MKVMSSGKSLHTGRPVEENSLGSDGPGPFEPLDTTVVRTKEVEEGSSPEQW